MVTLFRFGPAWEKFGCISQFVLKVEAYLRMTGIDFEVRNLGMEFAESAPWVAIWPGVAISLAVFAFNLFGDGVRDTLDPKLRSR